MNIQTLRDENVITKTGTINTAVLRREWFKDTQTYKDILNETSWMDCLNPKIGIRIKSIILNINEISYCPHCENSCDFSPYKDILFRKTCGNEKCVISEQKYDRNKEYRKKLSKSKKKYREVLLNDFINYYDNSSIIIDDEILLKWLNIKFQVSDNKALFTNNEYEEQKDIMCNILHITDNIPVDMKNFKWSQRIYHILNDIYEIPKCECGTELYYINRKKGYTTMCHSCLIKNGPKLRGLKRIEFVEKRISKKFKILNNPESLNSNPVKLKHIKCGYIFERWVNNGRWKDIKCPKCDCHTSKDEKEIRLFIENFTDIKIHTKIKNYEIDILDDIGKIGIEYNGIYWHSEINGGKSRNYHLNKTKLCNENNIRLIHIFENEWKYKQNIVKSRLKNILGKTKYKIYGRKCEIGEIDCKIKNRFLDKYHIQGFDKSSIKLGAFYKNRLIAVMTFRKQKSDKKEGYELSRYATISNFNCIGVAGKLLKYFEKTYNPKSIITYADKRWSEGNLYKQLGFIHKHDSTPNYFYFNTSNTIMLLGRQQFQKHKLKNKLGVFDPKLSEWKNMKANGYDRIWDCGNAVFEKTY